MKNQNQIDLDLQLYIDISKSLRKYFREHRKNIIRKNSNLPFLSCKLVNIEIMKSYKNLQKEYKIIKHQIKQLSNRLNIQQIDKYL